MHSRYDSHHDERARTQTQSAQVSANTYHQHNTPFKTIEKESGIYIHNILCCGPQFALKRSTQPQFQSNGQRVRFACRSRAVPAISYKYTILCGPILFVVASVFRVSYCDSVREFVDCTYIVFIHRARVCSAQVHTYQPNQIWFCSVSC